MPKLSVSKIEHHVFRLTNRERRRRGARPLAWERPIGMVARRHSRDMSRRSYLDHQTRGTGETPTDRAQKAGLDMALGENIAQTWRHSYITITKNSAKHYHGFKDEKAIAASLVRMWMNSPGHRANMLDGSYNQIGVGVWINYKSGKVHATQNFACTQPKRKGRPKRKNHLGSAYRFILLSAGIAFMIIVLSLLL